MKCAVKYRTEIQVSMKNNGVLFNVVVNTFTFLNTVYYLKKDLLSR